MKQIWQRIFVMTVGLLVLMQLTSFVLHRYSLNSEEFRRYAAENIQAMAGGLEGASLEAARAASALFNRRGNRIWVLTAMRDGQEVVVAGNRDFERARVVEEAGDKYWKEGGLEIWGTKDERHRFVASAPVKLSDAEANLYISYRPPRGPELWSLFLQGVLGFSIVGCILAFWLARGVSRPLRSLRGDVLEIAGGSLEKRVSVAGPDEVRDVAVAVNHMADSLAKYIRNMRELVANISHELRSPLARMQVSMALLEEKLAGKSDEKTMNQIRLLQEEMEHMNKLIGDTLLSSKLDLHGAPPLSGKVAFSELSAEMARRQAPLMEKRGMHFEAALEEGLVLPGDETLLCNLVSNFLDNAAKYTPAGGRVWLRLFREGQEAVLEVENTHSGLSPEVLEKIFEPFYRGGIATGGGVGLGLSLVRQIAQLHKGNVSAENTARGVLFRLRLPLALYPPLV